MSGPPPIKSNVKTVSADVAPSIRPGDLVVSTQPEQVPSLYRYLPQGVVYLTPLGLVSDPRQTDWRDGLNRLRHGQAETELLPAIGRMDERQADPDRHARAGQAALAGAVGARGPHPHARVARGAAGQPAPAGPGRGRDAPRRARTTVRAQLYEIR